jgi:hypothetical protein
MASRRNRRNTRRNVRRNRRNTRRNYRGGSVPAPVNVDPMGDMTKQSLNQGQQFASYHTNQHGGAALVGGPYPGIVGGEALLSDTLAASARVGPLNAALNEIKGMQDGGKRRRNTRRSTRRSRKASKKNRKASKKNRKNRRSSRSNRRSSRSNRKTSRRNRRYHGGAMPAMNPGSTSAPGLILPSNVSVPGMNPEWKLAENPRAFAPSY